MPPPLPKPVGSALDLIGHTPMLELHGFDTGPCKLFLKLENTNPGGSIKDRIALTMIEAAEADGRLKPGGTIIEATAGNTGLGLAQVGILKGYRLILVVPDKMSREKIQHLRGLGVDVRLTRSDVGKGHPEYYQDIAERIAADTDNSVFINQFANPANPLAHETTTGPEILEQMDGDLDAMVVGVGSGGTLTGLGRFFAKASPKTKMIVADPVGSILAPLINDGLNVEPGSWVVEGIGEDFIPPNCDLSFTHKAYAVSDSDSMSAARELLRVAGVLGGSSSGTLLAAALRYCRDQSEAQRVCTFVCDTGSKYLSKMFNDYWLADQGLAQRPMHDNLGDLISRHAQEGGGGDREPGGHPAHCLQPHARRRRVPAAGAQGRPPGGPAGRERHPVRRRARERAQGTLRPPGLLRHGHAAQHHPRSANRWRPCSRCSSATRWPW